MGYCLPASPSGRRASEAGMPNIEYFQQIKHKNSKQNHTAQADFYCHQDNRIMRWLITVGWTGWIDLLMHSQGIIT